MILGLLLAGAQAGELVEAWVEATPAEIAAAGLSFAEGRRGPAIRVIGPAEAVAALGGVPIAAAVGGYAPTSAEVGATLLDLAAASGGRAEVVDLGETVGGRPIVALRIGTGSRAIRVLGGHHGDEGSSVVVALAVATALVEDPTRLPSDTEVWVVPAVNADGLDAGTRHNQNGVDLNRNYAWEWSESTPYGGPSPFSEPETRAIRALARARSFVGGLSLHSGATNLGWVWNWTTTERAVDEPLLIDLAEGYADTCTVPDFWTTNGADWYETRGDTTDWTYARWGALDYTLELTNEKSPPADLVDTYVGDHLEAILGFLSVAPSLAYTVVDAETAAAIPATVRGPDLAPTWTGPSGVVTRWYHGDPGALTLSSPGYADGPLGVPLQPLAPVDGRPEPALLSRGEGVTRVHIPGFGDGPLTLSQPGEGDVIVPAAETDGWDVDPNALASGVWTLAGDGGVLPRALFVGEAADRVAIEEVRVDGNTVVLRGHGFGRGSEAWAVSGPSRTLRPLPRLGATSVTLAFGWLPTDDDLLVWSNGAWLGAIAPAGAPVFDRSAPEDTGSSEVATRNPAEDPGGASCATNTTEIKSVSTLILLILTARRKKIQFN